MVHTYSKSWPLRNDGIILYESAKQISHFYRSGLDFKKGLLKSLLISLDRLVINLSTQIIVDGNSQKEFLIEKKILKKDNATVFYNVSTCGLDLKKFKPDIKIRKKERFYYKISDSATVFLYLGRLNLDKGIKELIESFLVLNKKILISFLVGPDEMDITEYMSKKGNNINLIHLPYTSQPQKNSSTL